MKNEPSNNIKNRVDEKLRSASNIVGLKAKNKKVLVDYCGFVPENWSRAATVSSIMRGFPANCLVDHILKLAPI